MKINQIVVVRENEILDELSWKDIQKGAGKITKGAQKFTQNVNQTGDAVAGAASALGGAAKAVGTQAIARPVGAAYNAVKGAAGAAANTVANTYNDAKKGVQAVGQAADTVANDAGAAGTWAGNKIKQAGRGAANVLGGVGQAAGAVASVPQGMGRAAKAGYNAGVNAIGGPDQSAPDAQSAEQPAGQQPAQAQQGAAPQTGGAQATASQAGQANAGGASNGKVKALQDKIKQAEKTLSDLKAQLQMAQNEAGGEGDEQAQSTAQKASSVVANTAGEKAASALDALSGAVNNGAGMGANGMSLMYPKQGNDVQKIKDATGKEHQYKKVGQKWMDMATNKEVDPATAAMLDKQQPAAASAQAQKPAASAQAQAQKPAAQGGGQSNDVMSRMSSQLTSQPQGGIPSQDKQPAVPTTRPEANYNQDGTPTAKGAAEKEANKKALAAAGIDLDAPENKASFYQQQAAPQAQQAAPNFSNQLAGGKQTTTVGGSFNPTTMQNQPGQAAPTGIPNVSANQPQPTTGAKAVPQLTPAQRKTAKADYKKSQAAQPASMNNTVASSTGGGFQNYKTKAAEKGITVEESVIDFSAILARKIKL